MSKFKVELTLKQHTPIIHFQSDQIGATLRATELKPKFDRFLIQHVFKNDKNAYCSFLIDNDKNALDYKVKISSSRTKEISFEKYPPLYFARDNKKKVISDNFKIEFIAFDTELLQLIKTHFEAFLANTNFGTRQSKGYGGYYIDDKEFNPSLVTQDRTKMYFFDSNIQSWEKDIKLFYGLLRAGINEFDFRTKTSGFYAKSMMFLYAKSLGITWDKRAIKEHFINKTTPSNYYLMKDLLGFSTNEKWGSHGMTINKSSEDIQRYKSPVTFKPIQNGSNVRVYFFADQINKDFLGQFFKIESKGNKPLDIKTPDAFNVGDFLRFAFDVDLNTHIDKKYHSNPSFSKLESILSTLKAQK